MDITITNDIVEDGADAIISIWYFEDGDEVEKDAVLADIMVEKAALELVAPCSGILTIKMECEIVLKEGDVVATIE
ncbi:MAG: pyruvate/2-oxoglutarate dehydrogenase complex dihydrolipoamide acyltransferase (E2) component [Gammaproteobacteria bacterium]|jgi:pyruvate/2-oxoglutarate dehydrogenase complex dihydrolipoamide acyltransferase (E2) component